MTYKLTEFGITKDGMNIPRDPANRHYQQFLQDVIDGAVVEGEDVVEPDYATLRAQEYPPIAEQLDMQYHDNINGTTVWSDTIQAIKNKYPKTIVGGVTVGDVPSWVQEEVDEWLFQKQLADYRKALARLAQYPLEEGREEIREMQPTGEQVFNEETLEMEDVLVEVIVQSAIEPLDLTVEVNVLNEETMETSVETIDNPLVVRDREERAAAQEVIDSTPQSVKDFN